MGRRITFLVATAVAVIAMWLGYETGQWHYLAVTALAPIIWLSGRG